MWRPMTYSPLNWMLQWLVAVAGGGGRQQGGGRAARRAVGMWRLPTKRQDGWGRREGPRNRPAGERGGVALRFWAAGAVAALDAR